MLTLVIARHGETEHNAAGRYQGRCDAPLTSEGRTQAQALGVLLAPLIAKENVRFMSSDLGRALATAEIALPGAIVQTDARLRETHFGIFDGRTHDACLSVDGAAYRAWREDPIANPIPDGETFAELEARVCAWLEEQPRHGTTVAITHGGPALVLMSNLLRIPFATAQRIGLQHGEAVRFIVPSSGPVPDPVWLRDEIDGCGRYRARRRIAEATLQGADHTRMSTIDDPRDPVDATPRHPRAPRPKTRTPGAYRVPPRDKRTGLVIVNTGDGKGKTTAALGVLLRATGCDMRVAMLQFMKTSDVDRGEHIAARRLGVEILPLGAGFTWLSENIEEDRRLAQQCWARCMEVLRSGDYDVVIFDELTYALSYGWLSHDDVLDALRARPVGTHVIITGRKATDQLIEFADLVTEMREVKHPYRTRGLGAQPGIEL
jgi:cob(I)alamin adenosyltransferase